MATFTVNGQNIPSGAERHTAAVDPPDRCTAVRVQLTDPNSVWDSTSGTIARWGIQASAPDGTFTNTSADWENQGCVFQDNRSEERRVGKECRL